MNQLQTRIKKLEATVKAKQPKPPARFVRLVISPDREIEAAIYGGLTVTREPGEDVESFTNRYREAFQAIDPYANTPRFGYTPEGGIQ